MTSRWTVLLSSIVLLVGTGCATQRVPQGSTPMVQAAGEIPQDMLLEIGIEVFDPGLPEQEEEMEEIWSSPACDRPRRASSPTS